MEEAVDPEFDYYAEDDIAGDANQLEQSAKQRAPVLFSLAAPGGDGDAAAQQRSLLEEEREKHRRRAEKFGAAYVDPAKSRRAAPELALEARRQRLAREGFATGIDVFAPEEMERRAARAARFGTTPRAVDATVADATGQPPARYAPDEEDVAKIRRARKFGLTDYDPAAGAIMDMDLFEERAEVGPDVERRPDAIYLYGVDIMSTAECLAYFSEYGPTFVEWINDSSCVVTFRDRFSAARALAGTGKPLPPAAAAGDVDLEALIAAAEPETLLRTAWHRGRDFAKPGAAEPVRLIYRMAAVTDRKPAGAERRTRELWKAAAAVSGAPAVRERRKREGAALDADGDVEMQEAGGGPRGKRARRRRQRPQQLDPQDEGPQQQELQQGAPEGGDGAQPELDAAPEVVPVNEAAIAAAAGAALVQGRMGGSGGAAGAETLLQRILAAKARRAAVEVGSAAPLDEQVAADVNGTIVAGENVAAAM